MGVCTAWTDERLDDLAVRVDTGFVRVDGAIADLRMELRHDMNALRAEMRSDMTALRGEVRDEIGGLRAAMTRVGIGVIVTLVGVVAALVAGG